MSPSQPPPDSNASIQRESRRSDTSQVSHHPLADHLAPPSTKQPTSPPMLRSTGDSLPPPSSPSQAAASSSSHPVHLGPRNRCDETPGRDREGKQPCRNWVAARALPGGIESIGRVEPGEVGGGPGASRTVELPPPRLEVPPLARARRSRSLLPPSTANSTTRISESPTTSLQTHTMCISGRSRSRWHENGGSTWLKQRSIAARRGSGHRRPGQTVECGCCRSGTERSSNAADERREGSPTVRTFRTDVPHLDSASLPAVSEQFDVAHTSCIQLLFR